MMQTKEEYACNLLMAIEGVLHGSVRGYTVIPTTMLEIRKDAERMYASYPGVLREDGVKTYIAEREKELEAGLVTQAASRPPVATGSADVVHYLCGFCDLLAAGHDDRIDARVGAVRIVAESWDEVIVAVGIPVSDVGNKSLARRMRGARAKVGKFAAT